MKQFAKTVGLTLTLLLTGHSVFANHIGPIISDGMLMVLLLVLFLLVIGSIASISLAIGNMRYKSRVRRGWSFVLSLPMLATGVLLLPHYPVAGFIFLAIVIMVWVMILKSMSENVAEEEETI